MSTTINIPFVKQFNANVLHLAQQKGSRLRNAVRVHENVVGKSDHFERLGSGAMSKRTSRHQPTYIGDLAHSRRRATLEDYERGELIDQEDKIRLLINPQNEYAEALGNACGRQFDDIIIAAMEGSATAVDSADAGSAVAFPSAQWITTAGGLTLAKVLAAKRLLDAAEIPDDNRYFLIGSYQLDVDLLDTTEFTSIDYATQKTMAGGQISDVFLGFRWIRTERLTKVSSDRYCYAFHKNAIGLSIGADVNSSIDKRPDLSNSMQVLLKMTAGAVRIEEAGVVRINAGE